MAASTLFGKAARETCQMTPMYASNDCTSPCMSHLLAAAICTLPPLARGSLRVPARP